MRCGPMRTNRQILRGAIWANARASTREQPGSLLAAMGQLELIGKGQRVCTAGPCEPIAHKLRPMMRANARASPAGQLEPIIREKRIHAVGP
jgi:hypothetical protein